MSVAELPGASAPAFLSYVPPSEAPSAPERDPGLVRREEADRQALGGTYDRGTAILDAASEFDFGAALFHMAYHPSAEVQANLDSRAAYQAKLDAQSPGAKVSNVLGMLSMPTGNLAYIASRAYQSTTDHPVAEQEATSQKWLRVGTVAGAVLTAGLSAAGAARARQSLNNYDLQRAGAEQRPPPSMQLPPEANLHALGNDSQPMRLPAGASERDMGLRLVSLGATAAPIQQVPDNTYNGPSAMPLAALTGMGLDPSIQIQADINPFGNTKLYRDVMGPIDPMASQGLFIQGSDGEGSGQHLALRSSTQLAAARPDQLVLLDGQPELLRYGKGADRTELMAWYEKNGKDLDAYSAYLTDKTEMFEWTRFMTSLLPVGVAASSAVYGMVETYKHLPFPETAKWVCGLGLGIGALGFTASDLALRQVRGLSTSQAHTGLEGHARLLMGYINAVHEKPAAAPVEQAMAESLFKQAKSLEAQHYGLIGPVADSIAATATELDAAARGYRDMTISTSFYKATAVLLNARLATLNSDLSELWPAYAGELNQLVDSYHVELKEYIESSQHLLADTAPRVALPAMAASSSMAVVEPPRQEPGAGLAQLPPAAIDLGQLTMPVVMGNSKVQVAGVTSALNRVFNSANYVDGALAEQIFVLQERVKGLMEEYRTSSADLNLQIEAADAQMVEQLAAARAKDSDMQREHELLEQNIIERSAAAGTIMDIRPVELAEKDIALTQRSSQRVQESIAAEEAEQLLAMSSAQQEKLVASSNLDQLTKRTLKSLIAAALSFSDEVGRLQLNEAELPDSVRLLRQIVSGIASRESPKLP